MRENRTSGSMRRGEKRVMVHSADGHRTRKGGNSGAPPDLFTNALVPLLYRSGFFQMSRACMSLICRLMTLSRYSLCFIGARLR